ncbi:MAG: radical SAM protein [Proteobacteria bacterium]|nr:radical SAM protein [Pseudomonadota bacterium]
MKNLSFEQGPIRPPSEARSLLLRFTRNCNWNQCLFCPVYKGQPFSRRTVAEVKADIDTAAEMIDEIKAVSWKMGASGQVTQAVARHFFDRNVSQSYASVVAWLFHDTGSVFIQDANNLVLKTDPLVEMLEYLQERIQGISRITSYARSQTAARKTQDELDRIRQAGLNRIHVGMESGSDTVLKFMKKGVTAEAHIQAGRMIKAAGIELSEYWMPGLGGRAWWREHALESARVLSAVNPDFIRLRTLRVPEPIPLYQQVASGEFEPQSDDEVIEEIRLFIDHLEGITSFLASDHIMNLLQDVEGYLPRDKDFMLAAIDRYLDLEPDRRLHYRLGRRMGLYHGVADMTRFDLVARVDQTMDRLKTQYPGQIERIMTDLANQMI